MNYTKGEWKATIGYSRAWVFSSTGNIASIESAPGEEAEANAHLIAAAPEMYVILADIAKALDKGMERLGAGREMILRQALAKAEGIQEEK